MIQAPKSQDLSFNKENVGLRNSKKSRNYKCNLIKANILFWPGRMMDLKKSKRSIIMTTMVGRA